MEARCSIARSPVAITCRICGKNVPHPAIDFRTCSLIGQQQQRSKVGDSQQNELDNLHYE